MELFEADSEVRTLQCKHYFHTECIDRWLVVGQQSKTRFCPLCSCPVVAPASTDDQQQMEEVATES